MAKRLGVRERDASMAKSVSEQTRPDEHAGAGRLESIPLHKIVGNERNPRFHSFTPDEIRELRREALGVIGAESGVPDGYFEAVEGCIDALELEARDRLSGSERRERLQRLTELARSIAEINLIQPIVVYPAEEGYEVVAGQRRYLSHLLAGREEIRSIVRQPTGDVLVDRKAALVENLQREELTLRERVEAIEEIAGLHEEQHGKPITGAALRDYIHESERTCQRYLKILRASDVRRAIMDGEIMSYRQAAQATDDGKDASTQGATQPGTAAGEESGGRRTRQRPPSGAGRRGPRRTKVKLGATTHPRKVKGLIGAVVGPEAMASEYGGIDWTDIEAVQSAWNDFWQRYVEADNETEA